MKKWFVIGTLIASCIFQSGNVMASSQYTSKHSTHTVSVSIDRNCGNLALCSAIKSYLVKVSDPTLFKNFTIVKVHKNPPLRGEVFWTVQLIVHHQPRRNSAYTEGLNNRFVDYHQHNGKYVVTGLATGV